MSGLKLILILSLSCYALASTTVKQATLLLKEGNSKKAISLLEERFNETEDENEQGEIAYLLSLDPEYKTSKSMSYYIQNALDKYSALDIKNRARLTRLLADTSFETGNLETALDFYTKALNQPDNRNLYDYLTLQKTWVLVNLDRKEEALSFLYNFITSQKTQIIDSMVYDFGRLYVEYLEAKKNKARNFNLQTIPSSSELISGIFAGISRTNISPDFISPILKKNKLYSDFYQFGVETKRISSYNNCSLLSWQLPQNTTKKLVSDISTELIKCQNKTSKEYQSLYSKLINTNMKTNELALLSTSLSDTKVACEQYENLLDKEYNESWYSYYLSNCLSDHVNNTIVNYTRKSSNKDYIRTVLSNQTYENSIMSSFAPKTDDHIHFLESVFTKLRIKNHLIDQSLLAQTEKSFETDSAIYCFFYSGKCEKADTLFTFKYLTSTQKIIYTLDFIKAQNFEAAYSLLIENQQLLENDLIAKEVYLHASMLKGLYSDSFFKIISGEKLLKDVYISTKEQRALKKKLTSFWAESIDTIATMTRVIRGTRYLSTIEKQDQVFRQISKLQKKLAKQQWPNTKTREIVIAGYRDLLQKAVTGYGKHQTEISTLIESKLKSWKENI
ncbi:lipopolysaccharide assembly protein LapB [Bacteriovorax sp. Seq25_V]|uniref:tetratricopeptide repeat protein n=1 Tax=Bacteriovorax sp. Seq25_V TaxID=1201288 RepID=UPI000389F3CC|nr:hypothetical protein [Bacteriovorax sp. Seq25_V]EQC47093.1 hypothetical protein M900_0848 [Bacteriovorax sp. Seq25_V]